MHKKLMLACMAIAAFAAFVIAPAASAHTLTSEGIAVPVGTSITGVNEPGTVSKFTGGFSVTCETLHLTGTVTRNDTEVIEGTIPVGGAQFDNAGGAACSSALGATTVNVTSELCLKTIKETDTLLTTGCGGNVKFDLTVGGTVCLYEAASVSGSFTTNETPVTGTVSEQPAKEVGGKFFCPDEGKLDMSINLHTTGKKSTETGVGLTIS